MHYILLTIALNLGKENIKYVKLADAKPVQAIKAAKNQKAADIFVQNLPDSNLMLDSKFMNDNEQFTVPYISSDSFADLLPEDEQGNIVYDTESQGPNLLDSIKSKLIKVTEKKEPEVTEKKEIKATEKKEPEVIVGSQIQGPAMTKTEVKDVKDKIVTSRTAALNFVDKIRNIISTESKEITEKISKTGTVVDLQQQGPNIISRIKNKASEVTEKVGNILPISGKTKTDGEQPKKVSAVGTLFDSEYNQAIKGIRPIDDSKIQSKEILKSVSEIVYEEDKEYQTFLDIKEAAKLAKPEKILIPNVKPRQKELTIYKTQEVPEELLVDRSYQNRHISKIMQKKDKEKILEQIIEYGMTAEFRAFMNDLRDANTVMENQYTLLTYATKYKQYEIMKYLIHIGADVNKRDDRLDTPLIIATYNNDIEAVKILVKANANLDKVDILKRTPLVYCIEQNQELIGVYLIDNGANVNLPNSTGEGTLPMSIRFGRNMIKEKILEILETS